MDNTKRRYIEDDIDILTHKFLNALDEHYKETCHGWLDSEVTNIREALTTHVKNMEERRGIKIYV